ncbi:MAG: IS110 family transposase [Chloroflexota bacterium]
MLFVGDDWAEAHHDIEIVSESGKVLARKRLPEGVAGIEALLALIADHLGDEDDAGDVVAGIETDRGPWVQALIAAGYAVFAINPVQVARYRERHSASGAKSDPGDAHVLAEVVRLDRDHHRQVAGDSALGQEVRMLARSHQSLIWSRQRHANQLRSLLREYYPGALAAFGDDLVGRDALAVLVVAPTPAAGRKLTVKRIEAVLRKAGRQRYVTVTAQRIQDALGEPQLATRAGLEHAYGASARSLIRVITTMVEEIAVLQGEVEAVFRCHRDAEILLSQPGLGVVLAARVLGEFGDDPDRYANARARKNYSGMSPITRASGTKRVVLARYARNKRLADALAQQAFAALSNSPGARAYYDTHRANGDGHYKALRALSNRLVGILHGCLRHRTLYDETTAWAGRSNAHSVAA